MFQNNYSKKYIYAHLSSNVKHQSHTHTHTIGSYGTIKLCTKKSYVQRKLYKPVTEES